MPANPSSYSRPSRNGNTTTPEMNQDLEPTQLYAACQGSLQLGWLIPTDRIRRRIPAIQAAQHDYSLVGLYNPLQSHPLVVLGHAALAYLHTLKKNALGDALERLCGETTAVIVIAAGLKAPAALLDLAQQQGIALLDSPLPSERLVAELGHYLNHHLADSLVLHGVFMEVMGIGVLLGGDSGIGKSELALELITRGQRLIADDAPIFRRLAPDHLDGCCPPVLQDFLEVRGLGLLNIRAMFGDNAVKQSMPLQLIVRLNSAGPEQIEADRLHGSRQLCEYLGVKVCEVSIPVAPGRNLAVLVEAAARKHILYTNNQDPAQEFIQRQHDIMQHEG